MKSVGIVTGEGIHAKHMNRIYYKRKIWKQETIMKRKKFEWTGRLILIIFSLILVLSLIFFITKQTHKNTTEQLLTEYMNYINKHEYEKMYKMISVMSVYLPITL